ncbi:hypothetical protein ACOME3_006167 [Neoechinorhynchus agilis]
MNFNALFFACALIAIASCYGDCCSPAECRQKPICADEPAKNIVKTFKVVVQRAPNSPEMAACKPEPAHRMKAQKAPICEPAQFDEPEPVCQSCSQRTSAFSPKSVCEPKEVCESEPVYKRYSQRTSGFRQQPVCQPESVCEPAQFYEPQEVCQPESVCEPAQFYEPQEVCQPESVCEPAQFYEPESVCQPESVCEPAQFYEQKSVCQPESVCEPAQFYEPESVCQPESVREPSVKSSSSAPAVAIPAIRITFIQPKSEIVQSSIQESREDTVRKPICQERSSKICSSGQKQGNVIRKPISAPLRSCYKNAAENVCNKCNACRC